MLYHKIFKFNGNIFCCNFMDTKSLCFSNRTHNGQLHCLTCNFHIISPLIYHFALDRDSKMFADNFPLPYHTQFVSSFFIPKKTSHKRISDNLAVFKFTPKADEDFNLTLTAVNLSLWSRLSEFTNYWPEFDANVTPTFLGELLLLSQNISAQNHSWSWLSKKLLSPKFLNLIFFIFQITPKSGKKSTILRHKFTINFTYYRNATPCTITRASARNCRCSCFHPHWRDQKITRSAIFQFSSCAGLIKKWS